MKANSDELLVFVSVVECGSISAAAVQLGTAASAVSRTLSKLETRFQTTLINRTTRRMELSEEGQQFLESARRVLHELEQLEEDLALRRSTPSGRLRIDAATPFMLHVILPHIGEFRRLYPQIQLELNSNEQFIDLLEQRTDVAIRIGTLNDSTLHARALGFGQQHLVASPTYLAEYGIPQNAAELAQHSLLGFTQPSVLNRWPLKHAEGDRLPIQPSVAASSGETLRQLAIDGQGIACLTGFLVGPDIAAGRLQAMLADSLSNARMPIHAVYYRNSELALRIRCFLNFIEARLAEIPAM